MHIAKSNSAGKTRFRKNNLAVAKFAVAVALFAFVWALTALAQPYEILRADYGYGNQRQDVTAQFVRWCAASRVFGWGTARLVLIPRRGTRSHCVCLSGDRAGAKPGRNFRRAARSMARNIFAAEEGCGPRCVRLIKDSIRSCTLLTERNAGMLT